MLLLLLLPLGLASDDTLRCTLGAQIQEMNSEELSVAIAERDRPLVIDFSADCEQRCMQCAWCL